MDVVIQIIGSLLILVPFVLVQAKRLRATSVLYLTLNLVGSTVLAIDALVGAQWGFLLLEAVWAAVSLVGLLKAARQAQLPEVLEVSDGREFDA